MAWNVFKFCTALRGLGSIMILLVMGVVGVTFYSVVLTNYGPALYDGGLDFLIAVVVLILFHCLLVMLLWSYFSVVFTDPGSVPPNWRPAMDEERGEADPLNGSEFNGSQSDPLNQRIRYCRKCNQLKPPRCHHCSVCGRCVLKMDHHCVWVVNCVGALNYKYFLLFLFYTFLETSLVTLALLPHFIAFFSDGEIPGTPGTLATTFLSFVLNLAFALSVMGFLIMHIGLVAANTTTIEAYEKKTTPKWRYDLGRKKNFEQVFGTDKRYWFIPAYSDEDLRRIPALQDTEASFPCALTANSGTKMQRETEGRNDLFDMGGPFDAFRRFGSFGSRRTMMPSLFGGRDPFDDPFFTRPFSSMFEPSIFDQSAASNEAQEANGGKGIVIEELDSDGEEDKGEATEHARSGKEPSVEHPDDDVNDGKIQKVTHRNDYEKVKGTKSQACTYKVQTCKVTYGGVDGAYYTSTKSRRTGSDGVVIEEKKEADKTTGQATHRISRGIHDKGHSVTRKLDSDGKVDTTQILHNLNEDELADFEKAWKGNSQGYLPDWSDGFSKHSNAGSSSDEQMGKAVWDNWRLLPGKQAQNTRGQSQGSDSEVRSNLGGKTKKIVRINIE
ncbi:Zinc finger, DHHC-type, palmitoyltransferase [Corchorus olitorius]|uniref:S-acyltransferase n=1 Tax=Corchorus olitorius TaxID=93759 RepID=A0A1R3K0I7_9ROSI|nr:Zinc finger, DHHC-type, palmitoyltransferase [Corchorus olitorius]